MAMPTDNSAMLQQQQAQAAQAARAALKTDKTTQKPSVQFAEILRNHQQQSTQPTIRLMKNNPVAGAEVVKSAISGNKTSKLGSPVATSTSTSSGTISTGSTTSSSSAGNIAGTSSAATQSSIDASYNLMELNQTFNLQYLNLQEGMQAESRQYTAMSNVSKTKSDTAKNSLSNVK